MRAVPGLLSRRQFFLLNSGPRGSRHPGRISWNTKPEPEWSTGDIYWLANHSPRANPINAMSQSEVLRRRSLRRSREIRPGVLSIGAFQFNEDAGVCGRRRPLSEFESTFHWKSLRSQRRPRPTSTRSIRRASGFVQTSVSAGNTPCLVLGLVALSGPICWP
jgi:hypothetical protein